MPRPKAIEKEKEEERKTKATKKKSDIAAVEKKARDEGKTYGQLQAEKQSKEVKVQQSDGIKRQSLNNRINQIPKRSLHQHKVVISEIEEEIGIHQNCIDTEQKEVDLHLSCIQTHKEAIEILQAELKEEKDFLQAFGC